MKTPHIPVRSPDITAPKSLFKTRAPRRGESGFISKCRNSFLDVGHDHGKEARVVTDKTPLIYEGRQAADGGYVQTRRVNGRFTTPLVYDKSLMEKLNANSATAGA